MTALRYAVAGSGRWAGVMGKVLAAESGRVRMVTELRRIAGETSLDYRERLRRSFAEAAADIIWLAVPPGPHVGLMIEAAIAAHADVVVEKPWMPECGNAATLAALAKNAGRLVAVHFEYCFLESVIEWRNRCWDTKGLIFDGRFTLSHPDRLGLPAIQNLGCHLVAIHHFAAPAARIGDVLCSYGQDDRRFVRLTRGANEMFIVDFTRSTEPVVQRFVAAFARSRSAGEFAFDLLFAERVHATLAGLK